MKITIITAGSRGDVQPYVALGVELKKIGHSVCMPAPAVFRELITENGLQYVQTRSIEPEEFIKSMDTQKASKSKNKLKFMSTIFHELKPFIEGAYKETLEACQGSDAIISTLAFLGAYDIAEKLGIPCIFSMLFPVHSTVYFQSALAPEFLNLGAYNRISHKLTEQILWQPMRSIINHWRKTELGLEPHNFWGPIPKIYRESAPILCEYSPLVVAKPMDWPDLMNITGYWFLDEPDGWQPTPELEAFLEAGPPPVYIGLGSMTVKDPERITQILLDALKLSGQRGIISTGWSGLGNRKLPDTVLQVGSIPHSWLFKRMSLIIHHGGAGTTAAALRSGKPSIIIPFMFDQPFWGKRISKLGVGQCLSYNKLSAENLAKLISGSISDNVIQASAKELGMRIESENGSKKAADIIDKYLSEFDMEI